MPCASRVVLLAKSRQTFFEHPVLERDLGNDLLQLAILGAELLDFIARRPPDGVSSQLLLASLQEVLAPAVVEVGRDALPATQLRDALLAPQPFEYDPDLLLRRELPTGSSADFTDCGLRRLLPLRRIETLFWVPGPMKCLLAQAPWNSECC
jgi:hypothetical protein